MLACVDSNHCMQDDWDISFDSVYAPPSDALLRAPSAHDILRQLYAQSGDQYEAVDGGTEGGNQEREEDSSLRAVGSTVVGQAVMVRLCVVFITSCVCIVRSLIMFSIYDTTTIVSQSVCHSLATTSLASQFIVYPLLLVL